MIINLKSQTDLSGFYIIYNGGSLVETKNEFGLLHLGEHLQFRLFENFLSDMDADGISYNAYTSGDIVNFHFCGLEEKLAKYRLKIIKILSEFKTTKDQFEKERKIVLSEYENSFNVQTESHDLNLFRKLFNVYNPIGLREDLENFKFLNYINFYEKYYSKPSKIINVSKTFELKYLDIDFSNVDNKFELKYGNHIDAPLESINHFKNKTSSVIILSPVIKKDNPLITFLNTMISMGLKSPLYQEVRDKKGLVYSISCFQQRFNKNGITSISTEVDSNKFHELIDSIKHVFEKPSLFLNKERFNLVKDFYLVKKQKEEILRYENIGKYLLPKGWSVEGILKDVNLAKIRQVYEKYYSDFDKFYISNDKTEFKK